MIEGCLRSVATQSYRDIEHIVVDGASSDGTLHLLQRHRAGLATLLSEKDNGIYYALNKGVSHARGDVIGFLHADDLFNGPHSLSRVAAAFADPDVVAVYGDLLYVSRSDPSRIVRYWRSGAFSPKRLKFGWMPPHPTLYVRRDVYGSLGPFDTSFQIAADYDFMLRLLNSPARGRVAYIPEVLVRMRVGGISNRSFRNLVRKSAEDYRALRKNGVGGLTALCLKNGTKFGQFLARPARPDG
jgi:glycosyltransferase